MRRLSVIALAALFAFTPALAQDVINPQTDASRLTTGTLPAGRMPAITGDCTTSAGAVASTCTKLNGVDQTAAWTAFSPVPTCTGGVLTSGGASKTLGKTIHFAVTLTPSSGTCSAAIVIALPVGTSNRAQVAVCREVSNNNTIGVGFIASGGTTMSVLRYDGTAYAAVSGWNIVCSGVYEIQ